MALSANEGKVVEAVEAAEAAGAEAAKCDGGKLWDQGGTLSQGGGTRRRETQEGHYSRRRH